jgi:hypothetical protein
VRPSQLGFSRPIMAGAGTRAGSRHARILLGARCWVSHWGWPVSVCSWRVACLPFFPLSDARVHWTPRYVRCSGPCDPSLCPEVRPDLTKTSRVWPIGALMSRPSTREHPDTSFVIPGTVLCGVVVWSVLWCAVFPCSLTQYAVWARLHPWGVRGWGGGCAVFLHCTTFTWRGFTHATGGITMGGIQIFGIIFPNFD